MSAKKTGTEEQKIENNAVLGEICPPRISPNMAKMILMANRDYIKKSHLPRLTKAKTPKEMEDAITDLLELIKSMKAMCYYLKEH